MVDSLGILLIAKEKGFIGEINPLLQCIEKSGIHLSQQLIDTVLELAGETKYILD